MKRLAVKTVCCLAAGCAAAPVEQPAATTSFAPLSLEEFPGASKVMSGFDDRTTARDWAPHDQALFAVRLDKGGEVVRWLLHLDVQAAVAISSVEPPATEPSVEVRFPSSSQSLGADVVVKVFRADGALLDATRVHLPASELSQGLLASMRAGIAMKYASPIDDLRVWLHGFFTITALLDVVRNNDMLANCFSQVVDTTGTVGPSFEDSVATSVPPPVTTCTVTYSLPFRIDVGGAPALLVDLLASDASRPYAISGGIVAAAARHPSRSDVTLRMQLIAARCGR